MTKHFEELWTECEDFQKKVVSHSEVHHLIEELLLKISLYKAINARTGIPKEEAQKIKSHSLGEILITLTGISLKDNINVYEALTMALFSRKKSLSD